MTVIHIVMPYMSTSDKVTSSDNILKDSRAINVAHENHGIRKKATDMPTTDSVKTKSGSSSAKHRPHTDKTQPTNKNGAVECTEKKYLIVKIVKLDMAAGKPEADDMHNADGKHREHVMGEKHAMAKQHETSKKPSTETKHSVEEKEQATYDKQKQNYVEKQRSLHATDKSTSDKKHSANKTPSTSKEHSSDKKRSTDKKPSTATEHSSDKKRSTDKKPSTAKEHSSDKKRSTDKKPSTAKEHSTDKSLSTKTEHTTNKKHPTDKKHALEGNQVKGKQQSVHSMDKEHSTCEKHLTDKKRSTDKTHLSDKKHSRCEKHLTEKKSSDQKHCTDEKQLTDKKDTGNKRHTSNKKHSSDKEQLTDTKHTSDKKRTSDKGETTDKKRTSEKKYSSDKRHTTDKKHITDENTASDACLKATTQSADIEHVLDQKPVADDVDRTHKDFATSSSKDEGDTVHMPEKEVICNVTEDAHLVSTKDELPSVDGKRGTTEYCDTPTLSESSSAVTKSESRRLLTSDSISQDKHASQFSTEKLSHTAGIAKDTQKCTNEHQEHAAELSSPLKSSAGGDHAVSSESVVADVSIAEVNHDRPFEMIGVMMNNTTENHVTSPQDTKEDVQQEEAKLSLDDDHPCTDLDLLPSPVRKPVASTTFRGAFASTGSARSTDYQFASPELEDSLMENGMILELHASDMAFVDECSLQEDDVKLSCKQPDNKSSEKLVDSMEEGEISSDGEAGKGKHVRGWASGDNKRSKPRDRSRPSSHQQPTQTHHRLPSNRTPPPPRRTSSVDSRSRDYSKHRPPSVTSTSHRSSHRVSTSHVSTHRSASKRTT